MEKKMNEETENINNERQEEIEDKYIWDKRQFIVNTLVLFFTIISIVIAINGINNKNVNTQIFNKRYKPRSTVYNNPRVFIKSSPNVINNSNTVNTTNIINNNGVVNSSNIVNNNINTNIVNNSPVINSSQAAGSNFFSAMKFQKQQIAGEFEKNKLELERQIKQKTFENIRKNFGINKQDSKYPTGWYGFGFSSKYDNNFQAHNIKYIRLNTNQNMTFNDLCRSIGKKCTTIITVVTPNLNPDDEKCFEYKDEDILAFCE